MDSTLSITKAEHFDDLYYHLATRLLEAPIYDRGEVHAQKLVSPLQQTRELTHLTIQMPVPMLSGREPDELQRVVKPNLPWAEDQFQERVSGQPLNPPPSHEWWPYAVKNNEIHRKDEQFSHTYPERYWPKFANVGGTTDQGRQIFVPHVGIRFEYGDLADMVQTLKKNHRTRQAYLPIWYPEDTYAASMGQRVPCSLGYHFLLTQPGLSVTYPIRSCDFVRHFRDDVYMTCRLLQWVGDMMVDDPMSAVKPHLLIMNIGSLHIYDGDRFKLQQELRDREPSYEREGWDSFGAPV